MRKFKPVDNSQYFLLPPSVEDFIKEDHLARLVSEIVDNLDTSAIEKQYSYLGQKSYHPKLLLKLLFYGYAIGIRSGRKIAAGCESDVAFMYLACMYKPDFRTINDFRKNNVDLVERSFVEVLKLCQALNMVHIGTLVIDSTKLRANASSRRTKTKEQYEQWLAGIEQKVKEVLQQADVIDREEDQKYGDDRGDELPKEINTKEKLRSKIKEVIEQLKEGEKQNLTDADAKVIRSSGTLKTNYNCQASVTTDGIIVSAYVTNAASDKEQLIRVIEQAEKNTQQQTTTILADSGYASYDNYEQLTNLHKTVLIPDQQKQIELLKTAVNPFHQSHFRYDKANDQFICPEDKPLTLYRSKYVHKITKQQSKIYRGTQCRGCPSKHICTKGKARQIHVENRISLREAIRRLLNSPSGKQLYKLRQQIIEPIFGNIKHNLQYTMMHLRTLKKVNAEWQLICLTHNIKQIWKSKSQIS
ncbi:MAG: IS1182 family transposase [Chitinophagaceae bacterium]